MSMNPIIPNSGNNPGQVPMSQGFGEQGFNHLSGSKGYNSQELSEATAKRARLSRTKGSQNSNKASSLFLVSDNGEKVEQEIVYRTVMVDGKLFTLRLLAVA